MTSRRILYVQYTDPAAYPPVEHSSSLLADRGWDVLLLGTGTRGNHAIAFAVHPRLLRVKRIGFVAGGRLQKLHYLFFSCWTLYWALRSRPQWIYASDPLACPVVWWVQRITRVRVVYHEHDSPDPHQARTWFMRQVLAYRDKLARDAELCVLPQQERLRQFLGATRRTKSAYCVWNCPLLSEIPDLSSEPDQERSDETHQLTIYYHGSITPARLPIQLIVAASRFKGAVRVRVAGRETIGSIGYMAELIKLAAKNGTPELIEFLGTIPRRNLLPLAARAHVGLSLVPRQCKDFNLQHMVGASNKPFDYLAFGVPLLVTDLPEWVKTFVEPGYAVACDPDDPASIEAALRWYLEHPSERRQMGQKGKNKILQTWNYDHMFACVLDKLENS
jgi:glycosyltransferase involved in cell wall biosynthesis